MANQEKLAMDALEEIAGGISKEQVEEYLEKAKKIGKEHWGKGIALAALLLFGGAELKHKGRAIRDLAKWVKHKRTEMGVPDDLTDDEFVENLFKPGYRSTEEPEGWGEPDF